MPDLVAARARKDPDALALMQESHPLTYGWLDRQANRVAAHLGTLGVGRDVVVGLCLPRSFEMVIGALGIMKAGGAYLPMDPGVSLRAPGVHAARCARAGADHES